jgi:hypothetical protein
MAHSPSPLALGLNLEGVRYAPRLPDPGAGTGDELVVSHAEADLPLEDMPESERIDRVELDRVAAVSVRALA